MTNPVTEKLLEPAIREASRFGDSRSPAELVLTLESPPWGSVSKQDSWLEFVPEDIADEWESLSLESKLATFICAQSFRFVSGTNIE
jgi:hypothetical protein